MRRRAIVTFAATLLGFAFVLGACNAIVGVTDVRLKKQAVEDGGVDNNQGDVAPADVAPPEQQNVLEVALGDSHTCARKTDGTVQCWGDDSKDQCANANAPDGGAFLLPQPVSVPSALHITAGNTHTCVVTAAQTAFCWGDDVFGQLGDGKANTRSATPVQVGGVNDAIGISGGGGFTCLVHAGGGVSCFGSGLAGQMGNGQSQDSLALATVQGVTNAISVSAGDVHACAVTADGNVFCWGEGSNGQLGNGQLAGSNVPVQVPISDVVEVSAGSRSTCALQRSGFVQCWGADDVGQLGTGAINSAPNPAPATVPGIQAIAIKVGRDHVCAALTGNGAAKCWGAGGRGQLGNGQATSDASLSGDPTPVPVNGVSNALGIGAGGDHSCAPLTGGKILCWGSGTSGEIGDGQLLDQATPDSVTGYP